jgi:predicted XRE-type DNA-binding protein
LRMRSNIRFGVISSITSLHGLQAELAQKLQVYQSDVSNLLNGKNDKFSMSELICYAGKLNLKVRIELLR